MVRPAFFAIVAIAVLGACSREAPPPEKTVFEAQIKAIAKAKAVEKTGLERKTEIDAKLERESGGD